MAPPLRRPRLALEEAVRGHILLDELSEAEEAQTLVQHKAAALESLVDALQEEVEGLTRKWQEERRARIALERTVAGRAGGGASDQRPGAFTWGTALPILLDTSARETDPPAASQDAAAESRPAEPAPSSGEAPVGTPAVVALPVTRRSSPARHLEPLHSLLSGHRSVVRLPGLATPQVLDYGQSSALVIKPAKPELSLALGGPKVSADYREWAEPMLGGLALCSDAVEPQGAAARAAAASGAPFGMWGRRDAVSSAPWLARDAEDKRAWWAAMPGGGVGGGGGAGGDGGEGGGVCGGGRRDGGMSSVGSEGGTGAAGGSAGSADADSAWLGNWLPGAMPGWGPSVAGEAGSSCRGLRWQQAGGSFRNEPGDAGLPAAHAARAAPPPAILASLSRHPLLLSSPPGTLLRVGRGMVCASYGAGALVARQRDASDAICLVESGLFDVFMEEAGRRPVRQYASGDHFGDIALVTTAVLPATVLCREPGAIWHLSREAFRAATLPRAIAKLDSTCRMLRRLFAGEESAGEEASSTAQCAGSSADAVPAVSPLTSPTALPCLSAADIASLACAATEVFVGPGDPLIGSRSRLGEAPLQLVGAGGLLSDSVAAAAAGDGAPVGEVQFGPGDFVCGLRTAHGVVVCRRVKGHGGAAGLRGRGAAGSTGGDAAAEAGRAGEAAVSDGATGDGRWAGDAGSPFGAQMPATALVGGEAGATLIQFSREALERVGCLPAAASASLHPSPSLDASLNPSLDPSLTPSPAPALDPSPTPSSHPSSTPSPKPSQGALGGRWGSASAKRPPPADRAAVLRRLLSHAATGGGASLPAAVLAALAEVIVEWRCEAGAALAAEGKPVPGVVFIERGSARVLPSREASGSSIPGGGSGGPATQHAGTLRNGASGGSCGGDGHGHGSGDGGGSSICCGGGHGGSEDGFSNGAKAESVTDSVVEGFEPSTEAPGLRAVGGGQRIGAAAGAGRGADGQGVGERQMSAPGSSRGEGDGGMGEAGDAASRLAHALASLSRDLVRGECFGSLATCRSPHTILATAGSRYLLLPWRTARSLLSLSHAAGPHALVSRGGDGAAGAADRPPPLHELRIEGFLGAGGTGKVLLARHVAGERGEAEGQQAGGGRQARVDGEGVRAAAGVPKGVVSEVSDSIGTGIGACDAEGITPLAERNGHPSPHLCAPPNGPAACALTRTGGAHAAASPAEAPCHPTLGDAAFTPSGETALIPEEEAALVPHGGVAVVLQVETVIIPAGEAALTPEREASLITEREAAQQIPRREAALIPVEGSAHIPAVPAEEIALIPGAEAVVVPGAEALLVPEGALDPRPAAASAILGADASAAAPPISPPLVGRLYALKCLPKAPLLAAGRARQALNERRALAACHGLHPCLPLLHGAFQDAFHLFLLLEAVPGVELFYLLREARRFEPSTCALYLAMTGSALAHLHERGWVHRDVKPENLLLDAEGYIKLVDFGLATRLAAAAERTWTLCGTPEYTAPEVISCRGHGFPVDYWALGILLYELLNGFPPFCANDPVQVYDLILRNKPDLTPHMPPAAWQLCAGLLQAEPHARLGGRRGAVELMLAPFFEQVDWMALASRSTPAPMLPVVAPADPVELSDIEALLQPGYGSGGTDSEDAFTAAAAARHLFAHDFAPCEEPAGGKRGGAPDSPKARRMLAKRPPRL